MNETAASAGDDPQVLTVDEAASFLRIGRSLAYELVRRGDLPHLRFGKRVVIPRAGLVRYIEEQTSSNASPATTKKVA